MQNFLLKHYFIIVYRSVDNIITCIPKREINEMVDVFNVYDDRLQFIFEIQNNNILGAHFIIM